MVDIFNVLILNVSFFLTNIGWNKLFLLFCVFCLFLMLCTAIEGCEHSMPNRNECARRDMSIVINASISIARNYFMKIINVRIQNVRIQKIGMIKGFLSMDSIGYLKFKKGGTSWQN